MNSLREHLTRVQELTSVFYFPDEKKDNMLAVSYGDVEAACDLALEQVGPSNYKGAKVVADLLGIGIGDAGSLLIARRRELEERWNTKH